MTDPTLRGRCPLPLCSHQAITRIGLSQHLYRDHDVERDEPQDGRSTWVDHAIERAFPPEL